eukprot:scaffold40900_cov21-Tisochrysis_lutea.AAC.1
MNLWMSPPYLTQDPVQSRAPFSIPLPSCLQVEKELARFEAGFEAMQIFAKMGLEIQQDVCTGTSLAAHRLRIDSDTDLDLCGQSSQATQMCTDSDLIAHRLSTGSNTDVGFCGQTSQITQIHTKSILTLHRSTICVQRLKASKPAFLVRAVAIDNQKCKSATPEAKFGALLLALPSPRQAAVHGQQMTSGIAFVSPGALSAFVHGAP